MDRGRRISFWSRVEVGSIEDCWNWKGNLRKNGYGRWCQAPAHRAMYEMCFGPVASSLDVCHDPERCGLNRLCVNPFHLRADSRSSNMLDKHVTGSWPEVNGGHNSQARLTSEQVLDVYRRATEGTELQREIGAQYGITQMQVSAIARGIAWWAVTGHPRSRKSRSER